MTSNININGNFLSQFLGLGIVALIIWFVMNSKVTPIPDDGGSVALNSTASSSNTGTGTVSTSTSTSTKVTSGFSPIRQKIDMFHEKPIGTVLAEPITIRNKMR